MQGAKIGAAYFLHAPLAVTGLQSIMHKSASAVILSASGHVLIAVRQLGRQEEAARMHMLPLLACLLDRYCSILKGCMRT